LCQKAAQRSGEPAAGLGRGCRLPGPRSATGQGLADHCWIGGRGRCWAATPAMACV